MPLSDDPKGSPGESGEVAGFPRPDLSDPAAMAFFLESLATLKAMGDLGLVKCGAVDADSAPAKRVAKKAKDSHQTAPEKPIKKTARTVKRQMGDEDLRADIKTRGRTKAAEKAVEDELTNSKNEPARKRPRKQPNPTRRP